MGDEQGHPTGWSVTFRLVFSNSGIIPNFSCFINLQEGLLQGYTDRMVLVDKIPEIGDVVVETMAVPGHDGHNEKTKKRGERASTEGERTMPPSQSRC